MKREALIEAIFANMKQMHRSSTARFHTLMGRQDISSSQMELLMIVKHLQPISVKDIAAGMHLTPGAVTQLMEGLAANGYIERQPDTHDRRITKVSLAANGSQKLQELWEQRKQMLKQIMQTLDTDELAVMLRVQEKVLRHI